VTEKEKIPTSTLAFDPGYSGQPAYWLKLSQLICLL